MLISTIIVKLNIEKCFSLCRARFTVSFNVCFVYCGSKRFGFIWKGRGLLSRYAHSKCH